MVKLHDYRVRWVYAENGVLRTKSELYQNQSTPLTRMKQNCKRIASERGWHLVDVVKVV